MGKLGHLTKTVLMLTIFLSIIFAQGNLITTQFVTAVIDDPNLTFVTDKNLYTFSENIIMGGFVKTIYGVWAELEILNSSDEVVIQENIFIDKGSKNFKHKVRIVDFESQFQGFYQIRISYGGETQTGFVALSGTEGKFPPQFESQIKFDKDTYTWTDTVKIYVITPLFNQDSRQIETIGDHINTKIEISSSEGTLSSYKLIETTSSSGIFSGLVTLTGHSNYDVTGDKRKSDAPGQTYGKGNDEGYLAVYPNDLLKVTFLNNLEEPIENTVKIQFNEGIVELIPNTITPNEKSLVRVFDLDMNLRSDYKDQVLVGIWSDREKEVKEHTLKETEINNGIFEGEVLFSEESSKKGILVIPGSTVFVKYVDRTLPPEYPPTKNLDIIIEVAVAGLTESFEISETTQELAEIPDWIRNNAKWWSEGAIGDSDFTSGIQFLIKEGIMQIPETAQPTTGEVSEEIPSWIKNNAEWWSQGLISDDDFVKGIQYLVEQGIIQI